MKGLFKNAALSASDVAIARELYERDGLSILDVAIRLDVSDISVRAAFATNNVKLRGKAFPTIASALASKTVATENGCVEWTGHIEPNGYGRMTFRRKTDWVHRWAVMADGTVIPPKIDVCHKCDNRRCVNREHLFLGTRLQNMQDALAKGRVARGERLNPRYGEYSSSAKLTWDDVRAIRRIAPQGGEVASVAATYCVSPDNIRRILRHNTWRE